MERKAISKKIRFEVFKRDKFTCQYCGRSAPDIILEMDHIQPVSKDGDDDIANLVTSCFDCNRGKRDHELTDDAVIKKRKAQLDELQEKREQLEMMLDWQNSLINIKNDAIKGIENIWTKNIPGYSFTEFGRSGISKLVSKYGLPEILECVNISINQYLQVDANGKPINDSVQKTFEYIEKIARSRKYISQNPHMKDLYYIRGMMRNRYSYINEYKALDLLEEANKLGIDAETLKDIVKDCKNWSTWIETMSLVIREAACPKGA